MDYRQFEIWLADLHPNFGEETGKVRPVLVVQSDALNRVNHPTAIICPITTRTRNNVTVLRVNVDTGESGLKKSSAIMIDQIRLIDNRRFIRKIGELPQNLRLTVTENLTIVLDLEQFR